MDREDKEPRAGMPAAATVAAAAKKAWRRPTITRVSLRQTMTVAGSQVPS